MLIGLLTNPSKDLIEEINLISKLGFDLVEIGMEEPNGRYDLIDISSVKDALSVFDKAIVHTPPWIELASVYDKVREAWIEEFKKMIDTTTKLELDLINIHATSHGMFNDRRTVLDNMIKSINAIIDYANSLYVKVMLENMPKGKSIHSIDEFRYIMDNSSIYLHLDIGHAFTSNGMNGILAYINEFKDRIKHIHWHDNHGIYDEHLPLGSGNIQHKVVAEELRKIKYVQTITLEVFTSREDAKASADRLSIIL